MSHNPPMLPYQDSTTWFESGPEPIDDLPAFAILVVRVGMSSNAIAGQMQAGVAASAAPAAQRNRDILLSLTGSAALINV